MQVIVCNTNRMKMMAEAADSSMAIKILVVKVYCHNQMMHTQQCSKRLCYIAAKMNHCMTHVHITQLLLLGLAFHRCSLHAG